MRAPIAGGHRKIDPRKQQLLGAVVPDGPSSVPEACDVLIPNRFPAYISWERFAAIQQRLADNRANRRSVRRARPAKGPPYWLACSCVGAAGGG